MPEPVRAGTRTPKTSAVTRTPVRTPSANFLCSRFFCVFPGSGVFCAGAGEFPVPGAVVRFVLLFGVVDSISYNLCCVCDFLLQDPRYCQGLTYWPFRRTEKCRWGPVLFPVLPTAAICVPAVTDCPWET